MPASWLDPRLEIRASLLHGRGTFATAAIAAAEVVTVWEHRILAVGELAGPMPGEMWPRDDGGHLWLPPVDREMVEHFLNSSCEPNLWMADVVTLVARRDIAAGEELTADYALWELDPGWVSSFRCRCSSMGCRGTITGRDWESSELQRRYAGHFHSILAARIAAHGSGPAGDACR